MQKIKQFVESEKGKDILVVLIVILVGLCSFELGRLSKDNGTSGIKIEYSKDGTDQAGNAILSQDYLQNSKVTPLVVNQASSKAFFASNKGSKYYSLGCSAGKTIKQENRVYFTASDEAERAGYTLSSSCR